MLEAGRKGYSVTPNLLIFAEWSGVLVNFTSMRNWFLKQMDKLGLDTSNLKTDTELNGRFLEYGESENITFPTELGNGNDWIIKEWFFEKGQLVRPGDVIGAVEDETQRLEFESFVGGKLNYFKRIGQKVEGGQILAEITGSEKALKGR